MINTQYILTIVKSRLGRLDDSQDEYLTIRITGAEEELKRTGIIINGDSTDDMLLLSDYVAWQYSNRDKPGGMPEWLRLKIRERWLSQHDT